MNHLARIGVPQLGGKSPASARKVLLSPSGKTIEAKRKTEQILLGVQSTWRLWGIGSVGGQSLVGIPAVASLRDDPAFAAVSQVWPFETGFQLELIPPGTPYIFHAEIWPGVVKGKLDPSVSIRDQAEVRAMVQWLGELDRENAVRPLLPTPSGLTNDEVRTAILEEGWIFGSGRGLPGNKA